MPLPPVMETRMKALALSACVSATLLIQTTAMAAPCAKYEYAELKDMNKKQLASAYCNVSFERDLVQSHIDFDHFLAPYERRRGENNGSATKDLETHTREHSACLDELAKISRRLQAVKAAVPSNCPKPSSTVILPK